MHPKPQTSNVPKNSKNFPRKTQNKKYKRKNVFQNTCLVCNATKAKYKQPKTGVPFCSVDCSKKITPEIIQKFEKSQQKTYQNRKRKPAENSLASQKSYEDFHHVIRQQIPDADVIPVKMFEFLEKDVALKNLLKNKNLVEILKLISSKFSFDAKKYLIDQALRESVDFREFANACLSVVEPDLLE